MRVFGLTGGIATGKSTVSQMFRERGVPIIDADVVAREVVEPGAPALAEIAARFPGVIGADGRLDRARLGAIVFADAAARAALNAIVHPRVREAVAERTRALADAGAPRVIYDAALLIENDLDRGLDGVILVVAPPEVQRARLMARDRLGPAEADARIGAQMPLELKRARATWIIDNGGSLEETRAQVARVFEALVARG